MAWAGAGGIGRATAQDGGAWIREALGRNGPKWWLLRAEQWLREQRAVKDLCG